MNLEHLTIIAENCKDNIPDTIPSWLLMQPHAKEAGYYCFLHELVKQGKPKFVVELGIADGVGSFFLATGNSTTRVITIDNDDYCVNGLNDLAEYYKVTNLLSYFGDSTAPATVKFVSEVVGNDKIDVLFIDTEHNFDQATKEWAAYLPLLKPGSIIAHDDIRMTEDMSKYWDAIPQPKAEFPWLHETSYGVSIL